MADCSFSIPITGSAQVILTKARAAIMQTGGMFQGNDQVGSFKVPTPVGSIEGQYTVAGNAIEVDINRKPFFVSCSMIEKQLSSYFETFVEGV